MQHTPQNPNYAPLQSEPLWISVAGRLEPHCDLGETLQVIRLPSSAMRVSTSLAGPRRGPGNVR